MLAIKNGYVKTITNGDIKNCTILCENKKIVAIGQNIDIPKDATVIDASNLIVTPGLVDAHSHVGAWEEGLGWEGYDINEMTNPITPGMRIIDAVNPMDIGFWDARRGGVTSVQTLPGSGNVIGGLMIAMKTAGKVVDEMVIKAPTGMKSALGENPKRFYGTKGKMPSTRMGSAALLRETLHKASLYNEKLMNEEKQDFNYEMDALAMVIRKEIPLRVHCHRADDILTAIRIGKEFKINVTLEHCTEGHKVADVIAESDIWANVGPSIWQRAKVETKDISPKTPAVIVAAGGKVTLITDHNIIPQHYYRLAAGLATREGLAKDEAWKAVTINPAKVIGIEDRVGSLELNKDADIAIWSGDPFEPLTHCLYTVINGKIVYTREEVK
ncbi:amidohydrolase [Clostridium sp. 'deep sea']|uniref:amidohydrolase n=1 Tax=Clostridium sp. 'deep sea' TaxID=2779445 RepID=UPI001896A041|nr:amidohydrolase [Clostridium sp. 'deep sea']QOR36120.1 amidohydrolase [Clostridium sp. 'deep sea']